MTPQRHKKRRLYHKDSSIIRLRPTHPNHVWSVDFVRDELSIGRSYKMQTVGPPVSRPAHALLTRVPNLPFDEWTETFGSERLTGALLDWLTHHVGILETNGDS